MTVMTVMTVMRAGLRVERGLDDGLDVAGSTRLASWPPIVA